MAGFVERFPAIVTPNPGGPDDPLGESILEPTAPGRRIFEPADTRLVLGRHQDPHRELLVDRAREDGVPIHRRVAGGGAVVLAPGSVVVTQRLPRSVPDSDVYFRRMNEVFIPVIEALTGVRPRCQGHGDLAMPPSAGSPAGDGQAAWRKILGASQRQTATAVYWLGVFLVDDLVPVMRRYLAMPSRQPDYRAGRDHAAFCTALGSYGVRLGAFIDALEPACAAAFDA